MRGTQLAIKVFGDEEGLLLKANPQSQIRMCRHPEICFWGNYPTLHDIAEAFDKNTPAVWLIPQLHDLSEYCGCKDKLIGAQLRQCAEIIADNYGFLKITELMLFFYRFKLSRYGKFYGNIDPLVITESLQAFMQERSLEYKRKEQENNDKKEREERKYCISWDEYCKRHNITGRQNPLSKLVNNISV